MVAEEEDSAAEPRDAAQAAERHHQQDQGRHQPTAGRVRLACTYVLMLNDGVDQ